jgi:hypothetical protein
LNLHELRLLRGVLPVDAIKMDHDYSGELRRTSSHIYDSRAPKEFALESIRAHPRRRRSRARGGWEHKDVLKQKQREAKSKPAD